MPSPPRRTTLKDIAADLGVDVSTVSKALKNHPAIAAATRERVRARAAALGYRPDPLLSALARRRTTRQISGAALGWIYNHDRNAAMQRFAAYGDYLRGGRDRAAELGYALAEFWVGPGALTETRLAGILRARGIVGVVIAPQARPGGVLRLPWARLAAVAIGYTLAEPALHVVTNDHFQTMTHLVETLASRGRRRIGVYLWGEDDRRVRGRAGSAFSAWRELRRIPLLAYESPSADEFVTWVRRHRLDAVVTREPRASGWLSAAGLGEPGRILLASYALDSGEPGPGMDHQNAAIGAAAVDWVTRLVERGETGLPATPSRLLLLGRWRDPAGS
jgi:DNA-binding LacI/PurR family transcriptional regulator